MMNAKLVGTALTLACALAASPAFAKHGKQKEEFWDGDCKVERKWKKDGGYKEKRNCHAAPYAEAQRQPPVVITLPPVVILPAGY